MSITRRKYNSYHERLPNNGIVIRQVKRSPDDKFYKELFDYWKVDINKKEEVTK
jgi:hypothetical protein